VQIDDAPVTRLQACYAGRLISCQSLQEVDLSSVLAALRPVSFKRLAQGGGHFPASFALLPLFSASFLFPLSRVYGPALYT
jgi:hypothetical protein